MLPVIASTVNPSRDDYRAGYDWWLGAVASERQLYIAERLKLIAQRPSVTATTIRSSGSTGDVKTYRWGPSYDAIYSFILHDLVRAGSRGRHVAVLALGSLGHDYETTLAIKETPDHPHVQRWLTAHIKIGHPLAPLWPFLSCCDLIMAPSHFELIDIHSGLGQHIDSDCLLLSTAESLTDYVRASSQRWGFGVRDWMRCWDGGATFWTCPYGKRHWLDFVAATRFEQERLIATDYYNLAQLFVDYHNGDYINSSSGSNCRCGAISADIDFKNRQDMPYFIGPSDVPLTYRSLIFQVARACILVGTSHETLFTFLCFGVGVAGLALEVDYILNRANDPLWPRARRAIMARLKKMGFLSIEFKQTYVTAERKVKRLYKLP
jgi:hypothetical protein